MNHYKQVGFFNAAAIVLMTLLTGFASMFSIAGKAAAKYRDAHPWETFTGRVVAMCLLSFMCVLVLVLLNAIHDLIAYKKLQRDKLLLVVIYGMSIPMIAGIIGSYLFSY